MVVAIGPGKGARGVAPPVHQDHLGLGDVRADRQIRQGPILRHVECRRAVRGVHRYAIDYRKGGAGPRGHALVAPALADDPQTGLGGPGVDEPTVLAPAAAGPVGDREVVRAPAIHRDLTDLLLACRGDPPSARRNERPAVAGPSMS